MDYELLNLGGTVQSTGIATIGEIIYILDYENNELIEQGFSKKKKTFHIFLIN